MTPLKSILPSITPRPWYPLADHPHRITPDSIARGPHKGVSPRRRPASGLILRTISYEEVPVMMMQLVRNGSSEESESERG